MLLLILLILVVFLYEEYFKCFIFHWKQVQPIIYYILDRRMETTSFVYFGTNLGDAEDLLLALHLRITTGRIRCGAKDQN